MKVKYLGKQWLGLVSRQYKSPKDQHLLHWIEQGVQSNWTLMTPEMKSMFIVVWAALLGIVVSQVSDKDDLEPVVNTPDGKLRGTILRSISSPNPVYTFLGVPYAKPPVGDLRLALAEPVEPWDGERDVTQLGAGCPQAGEEMLRTMFFPLPIPETPLSEDCLNLDIYSPALDGKHAVLIFMHGGGFNVGKNSHISGIAMAAHGDVVLVSINYRIGALGFLMTPDDSQPWPSNLGLRDQQVAMRWVRDNIAAFGGDPDRVTIGGESAGSGSASAHILCPSSHGLFHRAILQSGSILNTRTRDTPPLAASSLEMIGCANLGDDATMDCLRAKPVEDILKSGTPGLLKGDDDMLAKELIQMYKDGKLAHVDLLAGVTSNEGDVLSEMMVPDIVSPEPDVGKMMDQLGASLLDSSEYFINNKEEIKKATIDHYFGGDSSDLDPDTVRRKMGLITGAVIIEAGTHMNAQYHSDYVPSTYFYQFDRTLDFVKNMRPSWHSDGPAHGYDLIYTMGLPHAVDFLPEDYTVTDDDIETSKIAIQYWANFVKTGNPNGGGLPEWKPFNRQDENYMILKSKPEAASFYKRDDMAFWNNEILDLNKAGNVRDEL